MRLAETVSTLIAGLAGGTVAAPLALVGTTITSRWESQGFVDPPPSKTTSKLRSIKVMATLQDRFCGRAFYKRRWQP